MVLKLGAAVAAIAAGSVVSAVAVIAGGGEPAGASPVPADTEWVVENAGPDGVYETHEGSATVVDLSSGATSGCPLVDGWGLARGSSGPGGDSFYLGTGLTSYGGGACTGPGGPSLEFVSTPDMVFDPQSYDAASDRVSGLAYPWGWALFLDAPGCQVSAYPEDALAPAPFTYDNRTGTLSTGPVPAVVAQADGPGCAGLAQVGTELRFASTVVATPRFTLRPA